jgi:hypothetical protein
MLGFDVKQIRGFWMSRFQGDEQASLKNQGFEDFRNQGFRVSKFRVKKF